MAHALLEEGTLTAEESLALRTLAGWGGDLAQIREALRHSLHTVKAVCDGRTVGMGRLVGDGVMHWYVQDVIVHPEAQGQGIGKAVMEALLAHIAAHSMPGTRVTVGLFSAQGREGFYEQLGFRVRPNAREGAGMHRNLIIPERAD